MDTHSFSLILIRNIDAKELLSASLKGYVVRLPMRLTAVLQDFWKNGKSDSCDIFATPIVKNALCAHLDRVSVATLCEKPGRSDRAFRGNDNTRLLVPGKPTVLALLHQVELPSAASRASVNWHLAQVNCVISDTQMMKEHGKRDITHNTSGHSGAEIHRSKCKCVRLL